MIPHVYLSIWCAGKTTLLRLLCGLECRGDVSGVVELNGKPVTRRNLSPGQGGFRVAYASSFDSLCPVLTVRETLEYAAMLRLRSRPEEDRVNAVNQTLVLLNLTAVADVLIGGGGSPPGINPAQLRRASIGSQVVDMPSVLVLDEPDACLEGYLADLVCDSLCAISRTGRNVIW